MFMTSSMKDIVKQAARPQLTLLADTSCVHLEMQHEQWLGHSKSVDWRRIVLNFQVLAESWPPVFVEAQLFYWLFWERSICWSSGIVRVCKQVQRINHKIAHWVDAEHHIPYYSKSTSSKLSDSLKSFQFTILFTNFLRFEYLNLCNLLESWASYSIRSLFLTFPCAPVSSCS